ncbi:hypothetical protein B0H17DRAFT_1199150 [Mycena rosella]|uniref:MYND-type domain-containing protein n=1 Tax=Mycena rosella TaxID=1033263 RepID=A0AAD7DM47_MYCRO|nr:hypothetical protein B0H17DRAFT_1199150 [Mycena rosella]
MGSAGSLTNAVEAHIILTADSDTKANCEEVVDALGGTVQHLASAVLQYFHRVCSNPVISATELFLVSCFGFLTGGKDGMVRSLEKALLSVDFIPIFIATMSIMHDAGANSTVQTCLHYLWRIFNRPPGYTHIVLALKSGLLPAVIKIAASMKLKDERPHDLVRSLTNIKDLLTEILPRATVHWAVVAEVKNIFPEAVSLAAQSRLSKSVFSRDWKEFSALAVERIKLLDSWERLSRLSFKACDNMDCGKIALKHKFKSCATCQSSDYCSRNCQLIDWRAGHRDEYQELRTIRLQDPETLGLSTRGKSFLARDFFTIFSYAGARGVEIDVKPASDVRASPWAAQLPRQVARMARSGGRMAVHLVVYYEGDQIRRLFLPVRTPTPRLGEGLRRAVGVVPEGKTVENVSWDVEFFATAVDRDWISIMIM